MDQRRTRCDDDDVEDDDKGDNRRHRGGKASFLNIISDVIIIIVRGGLSIIPRAPPPSFASLEKCFVGTSAHPALSPTHSVILIIIFFAKAVETKKWQIVGIGTAFAIGVILIVNITNYTLPCQFDTRHPFSIAFDSECVEYSPYPPSR